LEIQKNYSEMILRLTEALTEVAPRSSFLRGPTARSIIVPGDEEHVQKKKVTTSAINKLIEKLTFILGELQDPSQTDSNLKWYMEIIDRSERIFSFVSIFRTAEGWKINNGTTEFEEDLAVEKNMYHWPSYFCDNENWFKRYFVGRDSLKNYVGTSHPFLGECVVSLIH